jgi:hypothetical protein
MSGPASSRRPRRVARGGISWVTLLLLAIVAGASYLAWVWLPLQFDHYTVRQVVRDYMNQAIKNPDDAYLVRQMCLKLQSLRAVDSVDAAGRPVRIPAVMVEERQVTWERDRNRRPPTLRVAFDYERQVIYPFIDRVEQRVFSVDETNDMTPADWGPPR